MADNNVYSPIPARLHSVATEGVVSGADEIFDDAKGKRQSVINQETDVALDNKYDKDETYSKQELNNLITTPNQDYVTVPTYGSLPATGEADTVYRVSNYDGEQSQVDAAKYSEYAWDGTQYVFLCVKTQIGEVFDITAYNSNTKYADLSAALSGTNVPDGVRKGGMSVKFVQSSDNKYVQYRYMSDDATTTATFTDVTNWQGVEDILNEQIKKKLSWEDGYYTLGGGIVQSQNWQHTQKLDIEQVWLSYIDYAGHASVSTISFFGVDSNFISGIANASGVKEIPVIPEGTKYFALTKNVNGKACCEFVSGDIENIIPTPFDYSENLFYDPNFSQGFGVVSNLGYNTILNAGFNMEKQGNRNWLSITEPAKVFRPRVTIFSLENSEIKVGDYVKVWLDYQFTNDNAGESFIGILKNNTGDVFKVIRLRTLDSSGTLCLDFVVPSDMISAQVTIGFSSDVGNNIAFKVSNLRVYAQDRRYMSIYHELTFNKELTPKKNIFNKEDIVEGAYLIMDGNIISNSTIGYSNPIHVDEGETYHTNTPHNICFYDIYDNYVMGINAAILNENNGNFTIPQGSGITHIRANCYYINLDSIQIEKGTVATDYEPFILQNKYLQTDNPVSVDNETIGKTSENLIYVKDSGIDEDKFTSEVKQKLNRTPVINEIGNITITGSGYIYLATDYLNADGNVSGKENTVAEWQAMIDACAVTGGTIFFPDGHYVCKPAANETKYILLNNNVALKGSSTTGCIVELQMSDEGKFFRLAQNATAEISDMTVIHNLLNELITPDNANMGKRVTFICDYLGVNLTLNNLHIKAVNLNNGYDITTDNFQAASAAYMLLSVANSNCRVVANNCYAESPAWGIFNISSNSELIWNGDLRCWYKCTGVHGTDAKIIINGNLTSYGSGSYACISCSGGHTIVNGNLYRVPEIDARYSLYGSAIYAGGDDEPTIIVNGNIYTCSGVYQGVRGVCEITGNVYCIDKDFTTDINRVLFSVSSGTGYFADVKFIGNISCDGIKPFGLFDVNGGCLELDGNSFTNFASRITGSADGLVKISGHHKVVKDRFIRVYAGSLFISGIYEYSSNHEMIQLVAGSDKNISISSSSFIRPSKDYDRFGNDVTTSSGTGSALIYNHSAESSTKVTVTNTICNSDFSASSAFNAEIHNVVAASLGVASKTNTLVDL